MCLFGSECSCCTFNFSLQKPLPYIRLTIDRSAAAAVAKRKEKRTPISLSELCGLRQSKTSLTNEQTWPAVLEAHSILLQSELSYITVAYSSLGR